MVIHIPNAAEAVITSLSINPGILAAGVVLVLFLIICPICWKR